MGYGGNKNLTNNPNVFHLNLESEDAMVNQKEIGRFVFNVGSVLDRAPQLNDLSKYSHSTIKLIYFDIAESAADWKTAGVEVLIIKLANNFPWAKLCKYRSDIRKLFRRRNSNTNK